MQAFFGIIIRKLSAYLSRINHVMMMRNNGKGRKNKHRFRFELPNVVVFF